MSTEELLRRALAEREKEIDALAQEITALRNDLDASASRIAELEARLEIAHAMAA